MAKVKLGLTKNRLFEPCNVVSFCGKYKENLTEEAVNKALKMLVAKYEILSSVIEFTEGDDAYVVTDKVTPKAEFSSSSLKELNKELSSCMIFTENLFKFIVSQDNYFVILSHTAVSDGKSLLRLAKDFVLFYEKKSLSVEPVNVNMFSDIKELPVEVGSPVTEKLAANLDEKWNENPLRCDLNDYKRSVEQYKINRESVSFADFELSEDEMKNLKEYCTINNCDVSGAVAFCLYKALADNFKGAKKEEKLILKSDRRFFFKDFENHAVGPYDGSVEISLDKKTEKKPLAEQFKAFQRDYYKRMTSVFKSFYDDMLFMKLDPTLCNCTYMYALGFNKNKAVANLANNYGCCNNKLCSYSFCNLEQEYWEELKSFSDISCSEAFRIQYDTSVNFIMQKGIGKVVLKYRQARVSDNVISKAISEAVRYISILK